MLQPICISPVLRKIKLYFVKKAQVIYIFKNRKLAVTFTKNRLSRLGITWLRISTQNKDMYIFSVGQISAAKCLMNDCLMVDELMPST